MLTKPIMMENIQIDSVAEILLVRWVYVDVGS